MSDVGGDGGGDGGERAASPTPSSLLSPTPSSAHLQVDPLSSLPAAFRPSPPPSVRASSPKPPDELKQPPLDHAASSTPYTHPRFAPFSPLSHGAFAAQHLSRATTLPPVPGPFSPTRQRSDVPVHPSSPPLPDDLHRKKPPTHPLPLLLSLHSLPPNVYVQQRTGSILSHSMILKADSFSPSQSSTEPLPTLELHLLGAPNLQQVRPFFLFGVGQPTISGVRALLNLVKARVPHHRRVQWICLREEPILYVNNRPFVLRELQAPFHNLQDTAGIGPLRIDAVERRLKADVLSEALQHDANVLVHDEAVQGEVRACWESCDQSTVRTTQEVFDALQAEGYAVQLTRVPITAESVVDARQVDSILAALVEETAHTAGSVARTFTSPGSATHLPNLTSPPPPASSDVLHIHVFNCQLGRGRSTMGLVIAYLLQCHMLGYSPPPHPPTQDASDHDGLGAYRTGEWDVVLKLSRLLPNGRSAKAIADVAIDACGRVHHIRHAVVAAFTRSEYARGEQQHRRLSQQAVAALKRYFYLVCFSAYLEGLPRALTVEYLAQHSFTAYLAAHHELTVLADSLITLDEMVALPSSSPSSDDASECSPMDAAVFARSGSVLGQRCIVKSEYFAKGGEVSAYRGVLDLPLGSTPQPNVAGIHRVLRAVTDARQPNPRAHPLKSWHSPSGDTGGLGGAGEGEEGSPPRVVWINLREEPLLFLDGDPYLLRDYQHPFRILQEFTTGMTPSRSAEIEQRLKADVLAELAASGRAADAGQLLVHVETALRQLKARYLPLQASQVQTTVEVFAGLNADGACAVDYHRVPMHVEEVVGIASFDRLFSVLNAADLGDADGSPPRASVVFHDQKGGRRVAMGLVIACLTCMYRGCVDVRMGGDWDASDTLHSQGESATPSASLPSTTPPTADAGAVGVTLPVNPASPSHFAPPVDLSSESRSTTASIASIASSPAPSLIRGKSVLHVDSSTRQAELGSTGRGEYKGILSLIRILKQGRAVKEEVDLAIDVCGSAYNVREAIAEALAHHDLERTGGVEKAELLEAVKHAESYAMLILFNAYLRERREREEEHRASAHARRHTADDGADGDAPGQETDVIAREKAAELSAHQAAQTQLERGAEIDASQITSYNLFNPYLEGGGGKESDALTAFGARDTRNDSDPLLDDLKAPSKSPSPQPTSRSLAPSSPSSSAYVPPSFSSWVHHRPELRLALEFIHHEPEEALKLNAALISEEFAAAFERRRGNVLVRGSLIKSDHFAGVMNKAVVQLVEGAVNFRPIDGFPVAGTGIPRAEGIANILRFWTAGEACCDEDSGVVVAPAFRATCLVWLNLREEPILYVNHRPFVLRDADNPYSNLENTGITPRRVEAMEKQMKIDAWREVQESGDGTLLLHDEDDNGNLVCTQEPVTLDELRTPKEEFYAVFQQVEAAWAAASPSYAFTARYYRTPITDEQAPSPAALDAMIRYLEAGRSEPRRAIMINCQMGRGRTTTGLVISCLWCLHRGLVSRDAFAQLVRAQKAQSTSPAPPSDTPGLSPTLAASLRAGWYRLITSLVRVLPQGQALKAEVDDVIDVCGAMQNLRSAIVDVQVSAMTCLPKKTAFFVRRGTNYLIRYFFLITINAYLQEVGGEGEGGYERKAFVTWLNERPEMFSLLKKIEFPQVDGYKG